MIGRNRAPRRLSPILCLVRAPLLSQRGGGILLPLPVRRTSWLILPFNKQQGARPVRRSCPQLHTHHGGSDGRRGSVGGKRWAQCGRNADMSDMQPGPRGSYKQVDCVLSMDLSRTNKGCGEAMGKLRIRQRGFGAFPATHVPAGTTRRHPPLIPAPPAELRSLLETSRLL